MRRIASAAFLVLALVGCAHTSAVTNDPRRLADTLAAACAIAPKPLAPELQEGCDTLPEALRLAADTGEALGPIIQRAKALLGELGA